MTEEIDYNNNRKATCQLKPPICTLIRLLNQPMNPIHSMNLPSSQNSKPNDGIPAPFSPFTSSQVNTEVNK
jgi:hypothetical protein